jgi:P22_AR N-terminal domain
MKQELQSIEFYSSRIYTVEKDGEHYVAMKPICEGIGLQWHAQRKRILRHPVLNEGASMMDSTCLGIDGKKYVTEMLMLPLIMLNGWLFGVDANRVKPEIKDRLLQYQRECFDVLNQYWQNKSQLVRVDTSSTAACFSELHVFIELTRGRIAVSKRGTPYNTVSIATALVLKYLYELDAIDQGVHLSNRRMAKDLKLDARCTGRSVDRLAKWNFLIKRSDSNRPIWVCLNKKRVDEALTISRNTLLANQANVGYLEYVH